MKGILPGWFSFPFPLLVTQGTLQIVGEVIAKGSWQGMVSHPFCGHSQPCSILHGGLGGKWKCPFDPQQLWAEVQAGWGRHCGHLGLHVFSGFKHLISILLGQGCIMS